MTLKSGNLRFMALRMVKRHFFYDHYMIIDICWQQKLLLGNRRPIPSRYTCWIQRCRSERSARVVLYYLLILSEYGSVFGVVAEPLNIIQLTWNFIFGVSSTNLTTSQMSSKKFEIWIFCATLLSYTVGLGLELCFGNKGFHICSIKLFSIESVKVTVVWSSKWLRTFQKHNRN